MALTGKIDSGFIIKPYQAGEPCADVVILKRTRTGVFFCLLDVSGHGFTAASLTRKAKQYVLKNTSRGLTQVMRGLHLYLKGTRGCVAAMGRIDAKKGLLHYVSNGNIGARIFKKSSSLRILPKTGIIGYIMPTPVQETHRLADGDIVVLYSDGIKDHFVRNECEHFLKENAQSIAKKILKLFSRGSDDSACLALRFGRWRA